MLVTRDDAALLVENQRMHDAVAAVELRCMPGVCRRECVEHFVTGARPAAHLGTCVRMPQDPKTEIRFAVL